MYMPTYSEEWAQDAREDGNFIGGILLLVISLLSLGFTVLGTVLFLSGTLSAEQLMQQDLGLGNTGYMVLYACTYAVFMGVPMFLACLLFRRRLPRVSAPVVYVPSRSKGLAFLVGMGGCAVANFVASYVSAILDSLGILPPENPTFLEPTLHSLLLNLFALALLPAILEEMVFRKCVLATFQKYGNGMAIGVSALLFGVIHGGIAQSVFAFLVGLILGYITVRTGDIRTAVAVHFCNNAGSVIVEYLTIGADETAQGMAYMAWLVIMGICGLVALAISLIQKDVLVAKRPHFIPERYMFGGLLFRTPLMIIAIVLMVLRIIYLNVI